MTEYSVRGFAWSHGLLVYTHNVNLIESVGKETKETKETKGKSLSASLSEPSLLSLWSLSLLSTERSEPSSLTRSRRCSFVRFSYKKERTNNKLPPEPKRVSASAPLLIL